MNPTGPLQVVAVTMPPWPLHSENEERPEEGPWKINIPELARKQITHCCVVEGIRSQRCTARARASSPTAAHEIATRAKGIRKDHNRYVQHARTVGFTRPVDTSPILITDSHLPTGGRRRCSATCPPDSRWVFAATVLSSMQASRRTANMDVPADLGAEPTMTAVFGREDVGGGEPGVVTLRTPMP